MAISIVNFSDPSKQVLLYKRLVLEYLQEVCKYLSGKELTDEELIVAIGNGINVYYNYTGQTKCFNTSQQATGNLGDEGWGFQVSVHKFSKPKGK